MDRSGSHAHHVIRRPRRAQRVRRSRMADPGGERPISPLSRGGDHPGASPARPDRAFAALAVVNLSLPSRRGESRRRQSRRARSIRCRLTQAIGAASSTQELERRVKPFLDRRLWFAAAVLYGETRSVGTPPEPLEAVQQITGYFMLHCCGVDCSGCGCDSGSGCDCESDRATVVRRSAAARRASSRLSCMNPAPNVRSASY